MGMPIRVLTLLDHDTAGAEPGASLRSVQNMAERLVGELDIRVASAPWGGRGSLPHAVRALVAGTPHDVLYLHGFAWRSVIAPLVLRRAGLVATGPVVVAPRGAFSNHTARGARARTRGGRTRARVTRASGIVDDVLWHAASAHECDDIVQAFGTSARVCVAADVAAVADAGGFDATRRREKQSGELRIGLVARVDRDSNILAALRLIEPLRGRRITLDVYGPIVDVSYWRACERAIAALPSNVAVRAHGELPEAARAHIWASHHVCLVPTDGDLARHTLMDALSAGCPVIAGSRAPWRDLEYTGVGWDLPLDAPERFRAALQRVADMPDGEFREWSVRAAAFARERRAESAAIEATLALFHEAAGHRRSEPAARPTSHPALAA